jgi:hypothetical protein
VVRGIPADMGSGVSEPARPRPAEDEHGDDALRASVVACAQIKQIHPVVGSGPGQRPGLAEVLLVVDHNADPGAHTNNELPGVLALESDGGPRLSDTHDAGLRAAAQPIEAFLDDETKARPGLAGIPRRTLHPPRCCGHWEACHPRSTGLAGAGIWCY